MRGGGIGATLLALPTPLGSTVTLFIPPAFAGPDGIPLIGTFPIPASPAALANEAAGAATMTTRARAIVFALFDITRLLIEREHWMREADVVCRSAIAIKLNFRMANQKLVVRTGARANLDELLVNARRITMQAIEIKSVLAS
jgi:hypothetical protein